MNISTMGGKAADLVKCLRARAGKGLETHIVYGFVSPDVKAELFEHPSLHWHRVVMPKRPPALAQAWLFLCARRLIHRIRKMRGPLHAISFERLPLGETVVGGAPHALWQQARRQMGLSPLSQLPYRLWCHWMDHLIQRRFAGRVVVFSERDRRALEERGVDPGRIERVVIPTDAERFRPNPDADRNCVTIIGANPRLKGIDTALAAWPEIRRAHPELRLRIVSHGWKVRRLVERADTAGVELAPFIPEVERYYHSSRLVLMPSMFETWGNVVPEALACGVPVVVSASTPSSELVCDASLGAVVARGGPHDAETLARAAIEALELPMTGTAMAARHDRVRTFMDEKRDLVQWMTER